MNNYILIHESSLRLCFFSVILILVALWEIIAPQRKLSISKTYRWVNNLSLVFLNTLLLRLIFPLAASGIALLAHEHGIGLFNYWQLSGWWVIIASVILLDFAIYLQHVLFHKVKILWKLHQVHHADLDYDVTTGARFHPLEIVLSLLIKFTIVLALGVPVVAVIIFEILLNATAMFNHGNIRLPRRVDEFLRLVVVTPDMHRVHHSVVWTELNSNFGFNLPWWDRLCKTYQAQPKLGQQKMIIGLNYVREANETQNLLAMVKMPFKHLERRHKR
ncbi:MAG: sterol desaturase family protein [Burkholderiales bacterium]|nr:sterol desaturase family protein [Burkholderiales bacterium]